MLQQLLLLLFSALQPTCGKPYKNWGAPPMACPAELLHEFPFAIVG